MPFSYRTDSPRHLLTLVVPTLLSLIGHQCALAQDADDRDVASDDEIIITGNKLNRNINDTTGSVRVVTDDELERRGRADNLSHVLEQGANLGRDGSYGVVIRGIASNINTEGVSPVGIFVDGVLQTSARGTQDGVLSMWDVEQVELLRGSQSTTLGRNSLAGAVVIETRDPEFNYGGEALLTYGEENTLQAAIAQTGGLGDNLAFRIAVDYRQSDNFTRNETLDADDYDRDEALTMRGKLLMLLPRDGELVLTLARSEFDDRGDDLIVESRGSDRISTWTRPATWFTDTNMASLRWAQPLGDRWDLTATSAYTDTVFDRDSDGGLDFIRQDSDQIELNQEIRLNYQSDYLNAMIGMYGGYGRFEDGFNALIDGNAANPAIPSGTVIEAIVSLDEDYNNFATYGNIDLKLNSRFTVNLGWRADHETRDRDSGVEINRQTDLIDVFTADPQLILPFLSPGQIAGIRAAAGLGATDPIPDAVLSNPLFGGGTPLPTIVGANANGLIDNLLASQVGAGGADGSSDKFVLLPKIGLRYAFDDNWSIGAQIERGYRPGGISTNLARGEVNSYDPEFTNNYELSLRGKVMRDQVTFHMNAFYIDWDDQQVLIQGPLSIYDTFVDNAADSRLWGAEVEVTAVVNEAVTIRSYFGYVDTKYNNFDVNGNDFSGNAFRHARDITAGAGIDYKHRSGFYGTADVSYASEAYSDAANTKGEELDAFTLVNAQLGYQYRNWTAFVYGQNIFDEFYYNENFNGADYAVAGDGRVLGAGMRLSW